MLLFTGNGGLALLFLLGLFFFLWGGLGYAGFWAFKQTEYYKMQWRTESEWAKAFIKLIVAVITLVVSWLIFF